MAGFCLLKARPGQQDADRAAKQGIFSSLYFEVSVISSRRTSIASLALPVSLRLSDS